MCDFKLMVNNFTINTILIPQDDKMSMSTNAKNA